MSHQPGLGRSLSPTHVGAFSNTSQLELTLHGPARRLAAGRLGCFIRLAVDAPSKVAAVLPALDVPLADGNRNVVDAEPCVVQQALGAEVVGIGSGRQPGDGRRSEFARIETGVADVCHLARRSQVVSQSTTTTMCSPRAARSRTKSMRARASWSAHSSRSGGGHQLDESTNSLRRFGNSSCSSSSRSVESSATSSDRALRVSQ